MYHLDEANLFTGDHDPSNSQHLTMRELKLPTLQEIYQDHHAGGAMVAVEIPVGVQKLEPTFKLIGIDPKLLTQFGLSSPYRRLYTAYGVLVQNRTGREVELRAVMEGRLGKVEADTFQRGELMTNDYAINSIMHYEVHIDGKEVLFWDFETSVWRIDGIDQRATRNSILRIPRS